MFGSRIVVGILIGVFIIPVIYADPIGAFETAGDIFSKIFELVGAVGEVVSD